MEKYVWLKITENLQFLEHSNFIRGSIESSVRKCPANNLENNTNCGVQL